MLKPIIFTIAAMMLCSQVTLAKGKGQGGKSHNAAQEMECMVDGAVHSVGGKTDKEKEKKCKSLQGSWVAKGAEQAGAAAPAPEDPKGESKEGEAW